uniref:Uncharacterized protein n=1 Tax=Pygocentrus nattereri TaxID=42514 RepID=A0A3B4CGJ8_PYGNA
QGHKKPMMYKTVRLELNVNPLFIRALCGEGWRLFGVKCYYFSTDKLNWTMSRWSSWRYLGSLCWKTALRLSFRREGIVLCFRTSRYMLELMLP